MSVADDEVGGGGGQIERSDGIVGAWLGEELLLLDRQRARLHRLNRSAAVVWGELADARTLESLTAAVAAAVDVEVAVVADDVAGAVRSMSDAGLIAGGAADQVDLGTAVATLRAEAAALGLDLPADRLLLHGGAAALDGRAVAFVGPSGAGKSTATAALVRSGWSFLGDEVVVVDDDGAVVAHHRPIELTSRSVELVAPGDDAVGRGPGAKQRVDAALLPGGLAEHAVLAAIILPVHGTAPGDAPGDGGHRVLGAVEAVELLAESAFNAVDLDDGLDQLLALVASVPVLAVRTDPIEDLAATIAALLPAAPRP